MSKAFDIEEKDEKVWIVNNTSCHIDGEPFRYRQIDKCRAEALCEILNNLESNSSYLKDIMDIIHNIKYGDWKFEDLIDYIYSGISMDELWNRYESFKL